MLVQDTALVRAAAPQEVVGSLKLELWVDSAACGNPSADGENTLEPGGA